MVILVISETFPLDLRVPSRYIQSPQAAGVPVAPPTSVEKSGGLNQLVRITGELELATVQS